MNCLKTHKRLAALLPYLWLLGGSHTRLQKTLNNSHPLAFMHFCIFEAIFIFNVVDQPTDCGNHFQNFNKTCTHTHRATTMAQLKKKERSSEFLILFYQCFNKNRCTNFVQLTLDVHDFC